jgi:thioesterase domain-containing protein
LTSSTERAVAKAFSNTLNQTCQYAGEDFFALGGSSLLALSLFTELAQVFAVDLPVSTLLRASTVAALAVEIDRARDAKASAQGGKLFRNRPGSFDPLLRIQPHGHRTPLCLVHGAGGGVLNFRPLVVRLHPQQPVYGLQAQGIEGIRRPLGSIEAMANQYADAIEDAVQGPVILLGYSAGGIIALELAHGLRRRGRVVSGIIMVDAAVHTIDNTNTLRERLKHGVNGLMKGGLSYVRTRTQLLARDGLRNLRLRLGRPVPHATRDSFLCAAFLRARAGYDPEPLDIPITVLTTGSVSPQPALGWASLAPKVRSCRILGDHSSCLEEPNVTLLAREIEACLAEFTSTPNRPMGADEP